MVVTRKHRGTTCGPKSLAPRGWPVPAAQPPPDWALAEPPLPAPKPLGRPRKIELMAVVNGLLYIARTGCQWRMLPREFPHYSTVQRYFDAWRDDGTLERINFELLLQAREAAGRERRPSAVGIDRPSVKNSES